MKYTTKDIGCYFDGAFGFEHNARRLIDFAIEHGYRETPADEYYDAFEHLSYNAEDAAYYLNEHTTRPDNTHWSWEDGDFGLWQYDEDGELV